MLETHFPYSMDSYGYSWDPVGFCVSLQKTKRWIVSTQRGVIQQIFSRTPETLEEFHFNVGQKCILLYDAKAGRSTVGRSTGLKSEPYDYWS